MKEISILGSDMQKELKIVLDFIERHNKQDKNITVAESASKLQNLLEKENFMVKCRISNCLSGELVDGRYLRQICDKCEEHLLG